MVLAEIRDYKENSFSGYNKNMSFCRTSGIEFRTTGRLPISGYSDANRSIGYVFRLKYDYDNKYLAEFTGRYDGSYKFAGQCKWKTFKHFSHQHQ
ncbi:hypothetical protein NXX55_27830 [Bacteroides thetaiotaomicron]|nr:hypothetical protein [Bacteroides thetaiotaomicron]